MHHRFSRTAAVLLFFSSFITVPVQAQFSGSIEPPVDYKTGFDVITHEKAKEWLSILAGPVFEGRGTGQIGFTKAAHWVAGKTAEFGLEPMGDGGTYFQMLPMSRLSVEPTQSKLTGPNELSILFDKSIGLERFTNVPEVSGGVAEPDDELPVEAAAVAHQAVGIDHLRAILRFKGIQEVRKLRV